MARWWIIVLSVLGLSLQVNCNNRYDNYTFVKIVPKTDKQLEAIYHFEDPIDQVEVLKKSRGYNDSLDALVPPERMEYMRTFAEDAGMTFEVKKLNYGRSIEPVGRTPKRRLFSNPVFQYNSFAGIQNYIDNIALEFPELVTLQPLGNSYQGRRMKLVKISANPHAGNPVIFVDAGIHAREWVAPAMALYLIHRLTTDPEARRQELNGVDWFILPVVNPDGYEYTRTSTDNRMWRKTRSQNTANCYGVDGNRNYGFKWAVSGVSKNPCDRETYAGPKPFSEPETRMVRNIMMENANRIKLYVSLHSYGQYLVYPWGYTGEFMPKEWKKLDRLGRLVSEAVREAGGLPFHVMSAGQWYPAAGGSDDFAFGAVGVPYSYTMELTDGFEFIYPEDQLKKVLPQFYQGFRVFAQQIKREFGRNRPKRS